MEIKEYHPLSSYTTIGLGGEARYFIVVKTLSEMKQALFFAQEKNLSFFLLGKGSNTLFDDKGFSGVVIYNKMADCLIENNLVTVSSGYSFPLLGTKTAKMGLTGLEFAVGIPGSVGGAICMNAGAMGSSTWDFLDTVTFLDEKGSIITEKAKNLPSGYRFSFFQERAFIVVSATFYLEEKKRDKQIVLKQMEYRLKTQPYKKQSAGCMFKNPDKMAAGALIDQCKLKGFAVGKASVSKLHANFIVTEEGATSLEVKQLLEIVQKKVLEEKGIFLKKEVQIVPFKS